MEAGPLHDTNREAVLKMIKAKGRGKEVEAPERPDRPETTDLMVALEASVAGARKKRVSARRTKAA